VAIRRCGGALNLDPAIDLHLAPKLLFPGWPGITKPQVSWFSGCIQRYYKERGQRCRISLSVPAALHKKSTASLRAFTGIPMLIAALIIP
jgi:hypothetical protein